MNWAFKKKHALEIFRALPKFQYSLTNIAEQYNISKERVRQLILEVRNEIKKALNDDAFTIGDLAIFFNYEGMQPYNKLSKSLKISLLKKILRYVQKKKTNKEIAFLLGRHPYEVIQVKKLLLSARYNGYKSIDDWAKKGFILSKSYKEENENYKEINDLTVLDKILGDIHRFRIYIPRWSKEKYKQLLFLLIQKTSRKKIAEQLGSTGIGYAIKRLKQARKEGFISVDDWYFKKYKIKGDENENKH